MRSVPFLLLVLAVMVAGLTSCRDQGQVAVTGQAFAASASGPDPVVTLTADKRKLAIGEEITFTSVVSVPVGETEVAVGVTWRMTLGPELEVVEVEAPVLYKRSITLTWQGGGASSPVVVVRLSGAKITGITELPIFELGDFAPGDTETITVRARRVQ